MTNSVLRTEIDFSCVPLRLPYLTDSMKSNKNERGFKQSQTDDLE